MRYLLVFGLALAGRTALAQAKATDFTIHQDYVSTRALGMGNAFTAVADDYNAIFYNPAMLAWRQRAELRMFVRAAATPQTLKLYGEINDAGKAADPTQAYSDLITKHYGETFYLRAPTLGAAYVRPNWGIAFIPADLSLDAAVHRQIGPSLNVNSYLDSTLAYAYSRKVNWFGKGHLTSWGATVKTIHRFNVNEALLAADLAQNQTIWDTQMATSGLTFDLDAAFAWRPPIPTGTFGFVRYLRPTFSVVGRNLVDEGYPVNLHILKNGGAGQPPKLQRRMDVGTKLELPRFWVFEPKFALDVRDIGHDMFTMRKGFHVGTEMYWRMYNWWKGYWSAGLNQGYWTLGFGGRFSIFQLELASYGEEMGTIARPKENRRYVAELSLAF